MKSSEAKTIAQCVADMINTKLPHGVRKVPVKLNKLVGNYLDTYIPDVEEPAEIVETGSIMKEK